MVELIHAPTLDDALDALGREVAAGEARGERNFIFCEDRLTLLAERAVLRATGGTFLTEVTTFKRFLAGEGRVLSKQGSVVGVAAVLSRRAGELKCFKKGAAEAVYETVAQLKASRVTAEMLADCAKEADPVLAAKLGDLALVLTEYNAFLAAHGYLDESGYLSLLPEKIAAGGLEGAHVFFFAFPSFTRQAREGVRAAIRTAAHVTGVFLSGKEEFFTNEGARIFREVGSEFGAVAQKTVPNTLEGDALRLYRGLFDPASLAGERRAAARVTVFSAGDEAEELETVAAYVKKFVAAGKRYRDMAVLVPDAAYYPAAERAFAAYGIPVYTDRSRPLSEHPFAVFVRAVLEAAADGVLPEEADAIAANVYFGGGDVYRNYLLKYGGWRGAARREPRAAEEFDEAAVRAGYLRMKAILSLFPAGGRGETYAAAVRALYETVGGEETTRALRASASGAEAEFLDASRVFETLGETEAVAGGETYTAREFARLFVSGLSARKVAMIPQYADALFVGDVTESRIFRADVLFAAGLSDALPRTSADTAVITDGEIGRLGALKVEIEPAIAVVNARAREGLALNLTAFRGALYASCPRRIAGAETAEGEVLSYLRAIFEPKQREDLFPYDCAAPVPAAVRCFALRDDFEAARGDLPARDIVRYASVREALARTGHGALVAETGGKGPVPEAARLSLGGKVSPTFLERYFSCPYYGFAAGALRLSEREERRLLDAADGGSFVHAVLERAARAFNGLSREEDCRALAEEEARSLLQTPKYASLSDTAAGVYTARRLAEESASVCVAAYRQLKLSSFRVRETEWELELPSLALRGKADRVDEADDYVRVIDYKTGTIDDKPVSYYTGRRLQLELYLAAAAKGRIPAGAFYFPAADEFSAPDAEKFRMRGFFCADDAVLSRMDATRAEGAKSAFFEGGGRTEKGMSGADFADFLDYALLVSERAEREMREGNIAPSPYGDGCARCPYGGMCGFTGEPRAEESVKCAEIVAVVRRAKEGV